MVAKPLPAEKARLFNLHVDVLSSAEFIESLRSRIEHEEQVSVNFLNAHCFNIAQEDDGYKAALDRCTYLLNDGVGIDLAAKLAGIRFKENLNGTDLIPEVLRLLENEGKSVFLFGARPSVIAKAAREIATTYPNLCVAGYCDGYVQDQADVLKQINASGADAVILGLGVPLQELWVDSHATQASSVRLFVCGGAIFDFIAGEVQRAPAFIRKVRLEWMFRLIQEPGRLFSRYVPGAFSFLYRILTLPRR